MNSIREALVFTLAMGAVIFFCRAFPFLFFRNKKPAQGGSRGALDFIEKIVPPAVMTVLAFNSLGGAVKDPKGLPVFIAAAFTALVHLWKRNSLFSIFGGTAVFMVLERLF